MTEMKVSERRALVVYGDINGFTSWSRRVRPGQVRDLLSDTYALYDAWRKKTGYWIKKQSDGLIAVRELEPSNDRRNIIIYLRQAYNLAVTVNRYLKNLPFPRPPLFRLRGTLGDVWRLQEESGRIDFGGYQMNYGRRCLDILKQEMVVITEAVFDSLGRRACSHMRIHRLDPGHIDLPGIELEDQKDFYELTFTKRKP